MAVLYRIYIFINSIHIIIFIIKAYSGYKTTYIFLLILLLSAHSLMKLYFQQKYFNVFFKFSITWIIFPWYSFLGPRLYIFDSTKYKHFSSSKPSNSFVLPLTFNLFCFNEIILISFSKILFKVAFTINSKANGTRLNYLFSMIGTFNHLDQISQIYQITYLMCV